MKIKNLCAPLTISWKLDTPTPASTCVYRWQEKDIPPGATLHEILAMAFRLGLSRFEAWDLREIAEEAQKKHFRAAAAIYKRGVPVLGEAPQARQGSYPIEFYPSVSPTPETFSSSLLLLDRTFAACWPLWEKHAAILFTPREGEKTLASVSRLRWAIKSSSPETLVVIVGGGITADIAAFAAALENRGFIYVPTTLLAMVDACIGGKTGVNFPPFGKNQLGLFAFPEKVLIYPDFLRSLPPVEIRAGGAECLKHALLSHDSDLIAAVASALQRLDLQAIEELLPRLIAIKADIVALDPGENGLRALLNFGHTLAHALEALAEENRAHKDIHPGLSHGQAVALGMDFALRLSRTAGTLSALRAEEYRRHLHTSGCLLSRKELEEYLGCSLHDPLLWQKLYFAIAQDKKNSLRAQTLPSHTRWILLNDHEPWGAQVTSLSQDFIHAEWKKI